MKSFSALTLCLVVASTSAYAQASSNPIVGPNQVVLTAGVLVGASLIGGEAEFCLNNRIGFVVGAGILGANGGMNLHIYTSDKDDYYVNIEGRYMPALGGLPVIEFGSRSFFGTSRKVGIGGEIGVGILTQDKTLEFWGKTYEYHKGNPLLTYCLGLVINL